MSFGDVSFVIEDITAAIGAEYAPTEDALLSVLRRTAVWTESTLSRAGERWRSPLGGYWLPPVALVDGEIELAPVEEDLRLGVWRFSSQPAAPTARGWRVDFDVAVVAALDLAIAAAAAQFDYSAEDATFRRSQAAQALMQLREQYARRAAANAPALVVAAVRDDVA